MTIRDQTMSARSPP